jgi:hypothetical protein
MYSMGFPLYAQEILGESFKIDNVPSSFLCFFMHVRHGINFLAIICWLATKYEQESMNELG